VGADVAAATGNKDFWHGAKLCACPMKMIGHQ
jgi:hypothetical protein